MFSVLLNIFGLYDRMMRSVSIASQGAYSDATEINGALENLDHAIEEFEGDETSSNCRQVPIFLLKSKIVAKMKVSFAFL